MRSDDTSPVKKDKLRLLRAVIKSDNYQALLREFIVSFGMFLCVSYDWLNIDGKSITPKTQTTISYEKPSMP